ncbi:hypothetical protein QBC38DRAFT_497807 [Podospora fimiseda]|uniref:Cytochrome c oxidase-assembly factor cox-23, mitochondrial n=1 Tax=Podospora fimiseda TaxID=252190 RepID=A0AAN7H674_9PEZI|nr:hypothetical protein QBC38DRAFT_497807 [Podospora fimiseda]
MATTGDNTSEPWTPETKAKFEDKDRSAFLDPCQDLAASSIRCLHRNDGDRAMCTDYFQAYRDCKKLWIEKRRMDKKGMRFF